MHNVQNIDENEVLRDALAALNENVPPMPEELHAAWMQKVENAQTDQLRIEKSRNRKAFTRFLGFAAAMVFVVGGMLLTRDHMTTALNRQLLKNSLEAEHSQLEAANAELVMKADFAHEYSQALTAYSDSESDAATADYAAGAVYDAALPEPAEEGMRTLTVAGKRSAVTGDAAADDAAIAEASVVEEKKIIRTASLTIQTQTYDNTLENLKAMCEAEGGWVESSSESLNSSTGLRRVYLTLRIPQDALDGYLRSTEGLGRITSRSENANDVTAYYQDTQGQLEAKQVLKARLLELISKCDDESAIADLEIHLNDIQYTIESLQSQLLSTDRQVAFSTLSITLREEEIPVITDATVSFSDRIAAAVQVGLEAIAGFAQDMLVFLVVAAPFIAVVAVIAAGIHIIRRIKRRNKK